MTTTRTFILTLVAGLGLSGCLSSIVDGACADGYAWSDGACRLEGGDDTGDDQPGPDAGGGTDGATITPGVDAAPGDGGTCAPEQELCDGTCTDVEDNPNSCGACGIVCPSGICADGVCVGDVIGRVILIGHDYRDRNLSETRVLANVLDLPAGSSVRVGVWRGTASPVHVTATDAALIVAEAAAGITVDRIDLESLPTTSVAQVIVIMPQDGSAAAATANGTAWGPSARAFIDAGGVIAALGGHNTTSHDLLAAAGLLDATPAADATGDDLVITAPTDALAAAVLAPYRAEHSTSAYVAGRGVVVVEDEAGDAVVIDAAGL